jgi:hypothetical protein
MKYYPTCKKGPQLLTVPEMSNPIEAMQEFFWSYELHEIRNHCWNWLVTAMQDEEVNAGNLILFYENLMKFIEAGYLLCKGEDAAV